MSLPPITEQVARGLIQFSDQSIDGPMDGAGDPFYVNGAFLTTEEKLDVDAARDWVRRLTKGNDLIA